MDDTQINLRRIDRWINDILSPDAVERHEAFGRLCACLGDTEVEYIYQALFDRGDTQSLYWLMEYLVAIESSAGFKKLWLLLNHDHASIRVQARQAALRVDEKARADLLLHLLKSSRTDDLCFALHGLGDMATHKAVYPILDVLESSADSGVRLESVRALEKLRDPAALGALTRVVKNETGEIREIAFRASVNLLLESGRPSFLKKYIDSESSSIRQIAYLAMLRIQGKRWEKLIARILIQEKEAGLKIRLLSSIRAIRTRQLLEAVFVTALRDEALTVRMVAQSVLKRIKNRMILKQLIHKSASRDSTAQELAIRLISEYAGSQEALRPLMRSYTRTDDLRLRLIILHVLGDMKGRGVSDFIFNRVLAGKSDSRAAAVAFVRTATGNDWNKIGRVFEEGTARMNCLVPVLNLIGHLPATVEIPQKVKDCVRSLMDHSDRDVRYHVVRCVPKIQVADGMRKLLMIAAMDKDRGVRFAAVRSLLEILKTDPSLLTAAASLSLTFREVYAVTCDIFRRIPAGSESNFMEILKSVLGQIHKVRQATVRGRLLDGMRLLLLIRNLAEGEKTIFLNCLCRGGWKPEEKLLILKILNKTTLHEYAKLDVSFMTRDYALVDEAAKYEYLNFFGKLHYPSENVRELLCRALETENNETLRARIYEILVHQLEGFGAVKGDGGLR